MISPGGIDGCSVINPQLHKTGPNSSQSVYTANGPNGLMYAYYTGSYAGTDQVTIRPTISGCNGYVYNYVYVGDTSATITWSATLPQVGGCSSATKSRLRTQRFVSLYENSCVDDPVGEGTGSFQSSVTDATVASPGLPLAFTRSFTSGDTVHFELGYGWHEPYGSYLVVNTGVSPNTATAYMGSGEQVQFTKSGSSWVAPSWTRATLIYAGNVYTLTDVDRVMWKFSTTGMLTSIVDPNGQTVTITGWVNYPTSVTASNGKKITLTYQTVSGYPARITKITLPDGRTVSYGYDGSDNLASVTDLRGGVTSYTYNSAHQLLTVTDPRGHVVVTNVYGDYGRLVSQTDALGNTTGYSWTPGGCPESGTCVDDTATAIDPRGNTWTDTYNSDGLLVSQTDPLGDTASYSYDSNSQSPLSYTDPLGNTVNYAYDAQQNPTQTTLPGPISTSATYDSSNNLLSSTDGRGYTTSYTYDTHGNPTLVTQPGGATIGMTYSSAGQLTGITDQAGKTTSYGYDSAGNLTSATTPLGNETTFGYDSSGRRTSVVDPRGNVQGGNPNTYKTTTAYDNGDEVTSVTDPLGHTTSYSYDADGNLTGVTDPNNNTWAYTYDADNRLTTVTAPDLSTTTYGYDQVGNLTSRTDANNNTTLYAYDADNRLITITDPLNRTWTLGYDADSNLISVATPSDGTIHYMYDGLGRRISTTYSDGTPSVSWSYDADGNRMSMTDGAGTVSYAYDQLDRLTQATRGSDSFSYNYDAVGRIASRTYPDGTATSYGYDSDGNLAAATTGTDVTYYQYDLSGNLTQTTLPNGDAETNAYDAASQLTQLNDGFRAFTYGYDPAGNVTSRTVAGATDNYSYDSLNRLTDITGATNIHYSYDPVGNRASMTDNTGTTSYSYDLADQLSSASGPDGTTSYGFDQNGNETSAGAWTYTFNLADELTAAANGTTSVNYGYDGDGNRLSATNGAVTTDYLWDPNGDLPQLAIERDNTGSLIRRYTYGVDRISMTTPSTTAYYSTDAIGSVTELSGAGGTLLGQYDTNPFGDGATSSNVDPSVAGNPFSFAAEYQDPITGLYDLRARQYDPTTGRFVSPDPLGAQDEVASLYPYVGDSPLEYADPSGMSRTPVGPPGPGCGSGARCLTSTGPPHCSWTLIGAVGRIVCTKSNQKDPGECRGDRVYCFNIRIVIVLGRRILFRSLCFDKVTRNRCPDQPPVDLGPAQGDKDSKSQCPAA